MEESANGLRLEGIGQIAINVQDLARATAFYRDTLSMTLLYEFPGLAFFDCGGVRLMLSRAEKSEFDYPASIIYYRVGDLQSAYQSLLSREVVIEHEPRIIAPMPDHDLWMAFFRDSEGNLVGLMSEVRRAAV